VFLYALDSIAISLLGTDPGVPWYEKGLYAKFGTGLTFLCLIVLIEKWLSREKEFLNGGMVTHAGSNHIVIEAYRHAIATKFFTGSALAAAAFAGLRFLKCRCGDQPRPGGK
jgi:hypothetical protein